MIQNFVLLPARCARSASSKKCVELPGRGIALDLLIPLLPVALEQPFPQLGEFTGRQLHDLFLEQPDARGLSVRVSRIR